MIGCWSARDSDPFWRRTSNQGLFCTTSGKIPVECSESVPCWTRCCALKKTGSRNGGIDSRMGFYHENVQIATMIFEVVKGGGTQMDGQGLKSRGDLKLVGSWANVRIEIMIPWSYEPPGNWYCNYRLILFIMGDDWILFSSIYSPGTSWLNKPQEAPPNLTMAYHGETMPLLWAHPASWTMDLHQNVEWFTGRNCIH